MKNGESAAAGHKEACALVAARFGELWLRLYAGRKLRSDPVFPTAFELLCDSPDALIDVGCGVGLLEFYLRERHFRPPIIGLDHDPRKIARALSVAARGAYSGLQFLEQNVSEPIEQSGNIVLFDLLHYLTPADQARLLERLAARVAPGGLLLLRDCPRDDNRRFRLTQRAERFAQLTTWSVRTPLHFPSRDEILSAFPPDKFIRTIEPLWGRTPFNNHLFIFRRRGDATAPAPGEPGDNLPAPKPRA